MKQFEYEILFFDVKKPKDYEQMRQALNDHGTDGWEVISADADDYGYTTFLKRELTSAPKAAVS
ncbi:hypothetical protein [Phaeobacter gallaeciensis]|uniref:hypothetical protein n=1 Tax=Phaeobacter gallaeciensis TaxID=60890 RepID=UPI00237F34AE|nr:hypothetical protein [Phaeobacter gallaeciensis]MDE4142872.1 hypothetical protein [Phaeobacter gallaeciensis]MDE4151305.1 hypothetical protein [Phaeobacter gallaeciensis]MDE4155528.1 hypothetical protein [Phaeobacter gallaeciensis]MDE4230927.1 hypothetical protein [Phaeobacter gallaeciensis]MDE4264195.1 hypothetical protein [Phaeobacter gallaeciensis]